MQIQPISQKVIKNPLFKEQEEKQQTATQVTSPVVEKPKEIKKNNEKVLPLVTAAVAVVSLGVTGYALHSLKSKSGAVKHEISSATTDIKQAAKDAVEEFSKDIKKDVEELKKGLKDSEKQINDVSAKLDEKVEWFDGYTKSNAAKIEELQNKPAQVINSGSERTDNKRFAYADGFKLAINADNGGKRILPKESVMTRIQQTTQKYVNGKFSPENQNVNLLLSTLGIGAPVWLVTAESIPEKEGGLGEVPVQMAVNMQNELGIDTTLVRPMNGIKGKSQLIKVQDKWRYKYPGWKDKEGKEIPYMDVDKVAEFTTMVYKNGIPKSELVEVFYGIDPVKGYKRLMFKNPNSFDADGLYNASVTAEESERYTNFPKFVYEFIRLKNDPNALTYYKIDNPALYDKIKAPEAIALNDWHTAALAPLMRFLAPVEASDNKLNPKAAEKIANMNLLYIVHNADYSGWGGEQSSDMLNTMFGQYAYDIYTNAKTGFEPESLGNALTIDNSVNLANMAMTTSTKAKPVSPNYSLEMATQQERGHGLTHVAQLRMEAGTMEGQSNGWDREVNEVSVANLSEFNSNLNKDKLAIFKFTIDNLNGIEPSQQKRIDEVFKKNKLDIAHLRYLIEDLKELDITVVNSALAEMEKQGITNLRSYKPETHAMDMDSILEARSYNKKMLFDHIKTMIEFNKKHSNLDKPLFDLPNMTLTDLSNINPEKLDEIPFFNMGVRFTSQKGIDIVVGAWENILRNWDKKFPGKEKPIINIGGKDEEADAPYQKMVTNMKRHLGRVGSRVVQWNGFVPNNILMAGSDWTMRPSHFEPDGDKWESLYKGTPVVLTRVGGHVDSIKDGFNGYLTKRTVPEIQDYVARMTPEQRRGRTFEKAVLDEKIADYQEALERSLTAFYNKIDQRSLVDNAIHGNNSWVMKDKDGKIVDCPLIRHVADLGFKLTDFENISPEIAQILTVVE